MSRATITGWAATTSPTRAYGGVQLDPQVLTQIAAYIRSQTHLTVNHDSRVLLPVDWRTVEVREMPSGALGVWIEYETDRDLFEAAGGEDVMRGFSFTMTTADTVPIGNPSTPPVDVSADADQFDQAEVGEARKGLGQEFFVGGGVVLQFAAVPPALVIVEVVGFQVFLGVMGNALWDGLKRVFRSRKNPEEAAVFQFEIREPDRRIRASIRTTDEAVLREALQVLGRYVDSDAAQLEYDPQLKEFRPVTTEKLSDPEDPPAS